MLTFNSCTRPQNELNQYFFDINQEVSIAVDEHQPERIKAIYDRELKKYKEFKTNQYLISSKFVELSLYQNNYNKKKQLLLYKLIQINNGQYNYISIVCNYHLSIQYENTSPELSLEFLNKAICLDEKSKKKYFLPHLYHQKGRYYYKSKDYNKALIYFNKSLKALDKNNILFIASMHNNFALCYYKLGKTNLAIKETNRAIQLLKEKKNKVAEDDLFLYYILGNLGDYYMELKNYDKAKELYNAEFNFDKSGNFLNEIMGPSKRLFNLLTLTNDHQGLKELIVYLIKKEEELVTIQDKIQANKFIQIYYANHNDFQNLKIFSEKGIKLNDQYKAQVEKSHMETSDLLNQYIIKNVNQKYDYEKKRSFLLKLVFFLSIILSATIIIYIITHNKKERELMENQKIILEDNKKLLEQDLEIQDQKLKNLYLRLNLKMETEKAFLESLKNLKKLRIQEPEQILKDLLLKVTNLLDIDKRDYDLLTESSLQNEHFIKKLSLQFSRLTKYELKLCVYFRLELSSKEIASFENTTPNTIRVYKTKIKTKIGLDKNSSLDQFLKSV
jgi:DNA-binding CsgD family transcriptional regulator